MLFGQRGGVVFGSLLNLHHLRRTGFARDGIGQALPQLPRRAPWFQHCLHGGFYKGQILGLKVVVAHRLAADLGFFAGSKVDTLADHMWGVNDAIVGQDCRRMGDL